MIRYAQNRVLNPNKIGPEYVNPHVLVMGTWQPDYLFDNNMIDSPASKNTWFKIIKIFEEIAKYASSTNTNLAIITIPSTVQVDSSHFDFYRKTLYNVSRELLTTDKPQQLLKEFTSKAEIPYLDLLPYFKKTPNTTALYFENDDHLSNEGHLLAYKLVEEQMLQPFIKGQLPMFNVIGIKKFHKKYTGWAVEFAAQKIRENEAWFNAVKLKAVEQNIPLDSMIMMDARYVVENDL